MEKRFVHLLMIAIVITCPVRCMVQGCGSYCTPLSAKASIDSGCCCSRMNDADSDAPASPDGPCEKCSCKCFCSGATLPDTFEVSQDSHWQSSFTLENRLNSSQQLKAEVYWESEPPDFLNGFDAGNIGRQIRNQHSSLIH